MIVRLLFVHTDEKNSNASVGTEALHDFGKDMEFLNKAYDGQPECRPEQ